MAYAPYLSITKQGGNLENSADKIMQLTYGNILRILTTQHQPAQEVSGDGSVELYFAVRNYQDNNWPFIEDMLPHPAFQKQLGNSKYYALLIEHIIATFTECGWNGHEFSIKQPPMRFPFPTAL